jgi:hypothetical protein
MHEDVCCVLHAAATRCMMPSACCPLRAARCWMLLRRHRPTTNWFVGLVVPCLAEHRIALHRIASHWLLT